MNNNAGTSSQSVNVSFHQVAVGIIFSLLQWIRSRSELIGIERILLPDYKFLRWYYLKRSGEERKAGNVESSYLRNLMLVNILSCLRKFAWSINEKVFEFPVLNILLLCDSHSCLMFFHELRIYANFMGSICIYLIQNLCLIILGDTKTILTQQLKIVSSTQTKSLSLFYS